MILQHNEPELPEFLDFGLIDFSRTAKDEAMGYLRVDGKKYTATCTFDSTERIWARVRIVDHIDPQAVEEAALECARRALTDEAWEPVAVDLCDGETIYSATFMLHPKAPQVEGFFAEAGRFLAQNRAELEQILRIPGEPDLEELLDDPFIRLAFGDEGPDDGEAPEPRGASLPAPESAEVPEASVDILDFDCFDLGFLDSDPESPEPLGLPRSAQGDE